MSRPFENLKKQLDNARYNFIPEIKKDFSEYSEKELHHVFAYCIICHAEIENYIETVIREKIQSNIKILKSGKGRYKFGINVLCWYVFNCAVSETDKSLQKIKDKYEDIFKSPTKTILEECQTALNKLISANNGIKEDNLTKLLAPIGIGVPELDQEWLNNMNSFGTQRGSYAHNSCGTHLRIDPFEAVDKVNTLVAGLEDFDKRILKV